MRSVPRFLRYARPYLHHVLGATFFGVLKFTLPATTAIAIRFMTDRLVAPAGTPPADFSFRLTERYLHWMAGVLPASWGLTAPYWSSEERWSAWNAARLATRFASRRRRSAMSSASRTACS